MSGSSTAVDVGRFARLVTLIAAVTAVSLLTAANVLPTDIQSIGFVAIGSVALVTAIVGFLISMEAAYDESMRRRETVDGGSDSGVEGGVDEP